MTDEDDEGDKEYIESVRDFLKKYGGIEFGYILEKDGSKRFYKDGVSPCEIENLVGGKIVYISGDNGVPVKAGLVLDKNRNPFWYFEGVLYNGFKAESDNGSGIFFSADGDGSVIKKGDKYLERIHKFLEKKKYWKVRNYRKRGKKK